MNFREAVDYLYSVGHEILAMKLGLRTVAALAHALNDPQLSYPAVHIAGTNGKGSTSAMVEAMVRAAGFRVGLFTSPHLVSITERIRLDGEEISPDDFARQATEVRNTGERLVAEDILAAVPTFFEQITVIAYRYFAEQGIDLAVLEVGMGGRLDATNICRPIVTAITPIGLDHQQYLGDTIPEIAGEKAGIIKPGVPVVVAPQEEEAREVILARARALGAPAIEAGGSVEINRLTPDMRQSFEVITPSRRYAATLSLRGKHQIENALTAIQIVEQLVAQGWKIDRSAMIEGLETTVWPGRLELLRTSEGQAPLLLDGAHNEAGAMVLRRFLEDQAAGRPVTLIFGVMRDKDAGAMAGILFPTAANIILTGIDTPRAADPFELFADDRSLRRARTIQEALDLARRLTPPDGLIVVCGSLYLVGEVKRLKGKPT